MKKLLSGSNITMSFGKDKTTKVLKGVDIAVDEGEFVALMGASGSGKSTLLYILSSIETADEGQVLFDGIEISKLNERELADLRRKEFGFVFQQPTMLKNLNLLDNIILPPANDQRDRKALAERALELMAKTGLEGLEERGITEVSGGQLQRAGICRAVLNHPKIIFADEPTGALDSKSGVEVMKLMTSLHREGIAILLVTHDIKVAAAAQRVLVMRDGEIQSEIRFETDDIEKREQALAELLKTKP